MRPEVLRGGHRVTLLAHAGRAVLRAWEGNDEAALAEAKGELRSVLPVVPVGYDPRPYIASQVWVFAKSMADPHEYLVIRNSTDWREHLVFVDWIRRSGEQERYQGRLYRFRIVDGRRYWTLGPDDTIANRAVLEPPPSVQLVL